MGPLKAKTVIPIALRTLKTEAIFSKTLDPSRLIAAIGVDMAGGARCRVRSGGG